MLLREAAKGETLEGLESGKLVAAIVVLKTEEHEAIVQGITQDGSGEIVYVRHVDLNAEIEDESRVLVVTQETWNKMKTSNLWNKKCD